MLRFVRNVYGKTKSGNQLLHVSKKHYVDPISSYWSLDHKTLFAASSENVKEVRIPTPFGHIAAKEYGDSNATHKLLAVHGWMDNCGSFDKLLPLIVKENDLHVIAMDEPGCGLSSHLPAGVEYPKFNLLKEMKRVTNFMRWDNFSIIGHSKGAGFALLYASVMPESVKSVIMLDVFYTYFYGVSAPDMGFDASALNMLLDYEEKLIDKPTSKSTFNEEETLKKFMTAFPVPKSEAVARALMKRGCREKNGSFTFTRDVRHRIPLFGSIASKEEYLNLAKNLRCDLLVISATKSPFRNESKTEWFQVYKSHCRIFDHVSVEGDHYVHYDAAEQVAVSVNQFLKKSLCD